MQRLWLTVDQGVGERRRSTLRYLIGLPISLGAIAISSASHHLLQVSLPYEFSLLAVVLAAAWGGTISGLTATLIGVPGALLLGAGSEGVTPVNSVTFALFCLVVSIFGGRVHRLNDMALRQTQRLRQRESYLQTIFTRSPAAMIVINAENEVLAMNMAARQLFAIVDDRANSCLRELLRSVDAGSAGIKARRLVVRHDGSTRHVRTFEAALPSEDVILRIVYIQDETEALAAAEQSARLQGELQQLGRATALGQLGSAIAHELNQPLTSAANFSSIVRIQLATEFGEADTRVVRLDDGLRNIFHASEILKRLRNFVRHASPRHEIVDVRSMLLEASNLGELAIRRARARFHIDISDDVGRISADAIQIQQVLVNLLVNAAEAVAEQESRVVSLLACAEGQDSLMIRIIDTGCGIDAAARESLFVPFRTSKANGLGVGLAISRTIVEAHGGTIETCDADGGGASFTVTLPRSGQAAGGQDAN